MSANTALDQIKARVEGHTEGPWEVNSPGVCCEGTCIDARNGDVQHDMSVIHWRDAQLIAAAPKLLAALEAVEALAILAENTLSYGAGGVLMAEAIRAQIEEALS